MTEVRRGGPPSTRAVTGLDVPARLDGRLDLDHLDAPVDLDVIGSGSDVPTLPERVAAAVAGTRGVAWSRRHRAVTSALVVGVLLLAGSVGSWWLARPVPLPATPLVLVTTSGPDRSQVDVALAKGAPVALTVHVEVSSAERPGVAVSLLSLTGPGLSPPSEPLPSFVDTTSAQSVARFSTPDAVGPVPGANGADSTVSASLDCRSPTSTYDALRAAPDQFGVLVRRTAPEGEVRVDPVPLADAQNLALVVRRTCLQAVADRELRLAVVSARALPGVAAADVDLALRSTGGRAWTGLRVSTRALPWIVNGLPTAALRAGGTVDLRARVWLQDCTDPSAALRGGLVLRTDVAPDDTEPDSADTAGNTLTLPVDDAGLRAVAAAFASVCTSPEPSTVVAAATIATGGSTASAGTLDLTVAVHAVGADLAEVDQGGLSAAGRISVLDGPAHLVRGVGVVHAAWELPPCADLASAWPPRLSVALVTASTSGGERRPYVVTLGGEPLLQELRRLCGPGADAVGH